MRNGMKTPGAAPQMPGGASGAPAQVTAAMQRQAVPEAPQKPKGPPAPPPKRFRVMNGGTIVWNNCRTALRAGKEITDATYDVKLLRRQGIRLEEIAPDADPAELDTPLLGQADVLVPGSDAARAAEQRFIKEREDNSGQPPAMPTPQYAKA